MESHGRQLPGDPGRAYGAPGARVPTAANNVKIKVSIPVKLGGYTGQRDQWEEFEGDYVVSGGPDEVVLAATGSLSQKITFSLNDLQAALRALGQTQVVHR